jgi:hypothetical protein
MQVKYSAQAFYSWKYPFVLFPNYPKQNEKWTNCLFTVVSTVAMYRAQQYFSCRPRNFDEIDLSVRTLNL